MYIFSVENVIVIFLHKFVFNGFFFSYLGLKRVQTAHVVVQCDYTTSVVSHQPAGGTAHVLPWCVHMLVCFMCVRRTCVLPVDSPRPLLVGYIKTSLQAAVASSRTGSHSRLIINIESAIELDSFSKL